LTLSVTCSHCEAL